MSKKQQDYDKVLNDVRQENEWIKAEMRDIHHASQGMTADYKKSMERERNRKDEIEKMETKVKYLALSNMDLAAGLSTVKM